MSRCFPFPPPGYQKKIRTEDSDLLAKEKSREKKHKKDKKDKEKREGKDKKDKERSKEKQREKKEKKDKHKEKKKDKEKERDKHRKNENSNTEGRKESGDHGATDKTGQLGEENKFQQEFVRRIKDDGHIAGSHMLENFNGTNTRMLEENVLPKPEIWFKGKNKEHEQDGRDQERHKERFADHDEKGNKKKEKNKDQEKEKEMEKEKERFELEPKKDHRLGESVNKEKENHREKTQFTLKQQIPEGSVNKVHRVVNSVRPLQFEKSSEASIVSESTTRKRKDPEMNGVLHGVDLRPNKLPRPATGTSVHVENGRKVEKVRLTVPSPDIRGGSASRLLGKAADRSTLPVPPQIKEQFMNGKIRSPSPPVNLRQSINAESGLSNAGKTQSRLPSVKFRTLSETEARLGDANKLQSSQLKSDKSRPSNEVGSSFAIRIQPQPPGVKSTPSTKGETSLANARKVLASSSGSLPTCNLREPVEAQTSLSQPRKLLIQSASTNSRLLSGIEPSVANAGKKQSQVPPVSSRPMADVEAKLAIPEPIKPPHPDLQYLDQVLKVPKKAEWSGFDDQEWLFSSSHNRSQPSGGSDTEKVPKVWSRALHIEQEDIHALPYVIPY